MDSKLWGKVLALPHNQPGRQAHTLGALCSLTQFSRLDDWLLKCFACAAINQKQKTETKSLPTDDGGFHGDGGRDGGRKTTVKYVVTNKVHQLGNGMALCAPRWGWGCGKDSSFCTAAHSYLWHFCIQPTSFRNVKSCYRPYSVRSFNSVPFHSIPPPAVCYTEIMAIGTLLIRRVGPLALALAHNWTGLVLMCPVPPCSRALLRSLVIYEAHKFHKNFPFGFFGENYFAKIKELSNKLCNKFEHKFYTHSTAVELQALKLCQQKPLIPVSRNEVKCQLCRSVGGSVGGTRLPSRGPQDFEGLRRWAGWAETAEIKCCHWQFPLHNSTSRLCYCFCCLRSKEACPMPATHN